MTKDILVQIPTERAMRPVVDVAISLDTTFGAHVDALSVGYIPTARRRAKRGSTRDL